MDLAIRGSLSQNVAVCHNTMGDPANKTRALQDLPPRALALRLGARPISGSIQGIVSTGPIDRVYEPCVTEPWGQERHHVGLGSEPGSKDDGQRPDRPL